jgi:hypothetical protein
MISGSFGDNGELFKDILTLEMCEISDDIDNINVF